MINTNDILSTIDMIDQQHLDIRTITMGMNRRGRILMMELALAVGSIVTLYI